MQAIVSLSFLKKCCKKNVIILAFLWTVGMLFGVGFAYMTRDHIVSLMHTAACNRVSIVGLIIVILFPLLLSAAAVRYSIPVIIELISFAKAFSYGYCLLGSIAAFQLSGWMIHFFLVFSDSIATVLLLWFLFNQLNEGRGLFKQDFMVCFSADLMIILIDLFFVSPFLVKLIN